MGNLPSHYSTASSTASSTSTFEMLRQLSYESDVFYADNTSLDTQFEPVTKQRPGTPDLSPENFPKWRIKETDSVLLKYMGRSYKPSPENLKTSAKELAKLSAVQKIPKFANSMTSQCVKLHWACLVGWCMCKYQYQPMTPLHLMPHTKISSNLSTKSGKSLMTSHSLESLSSSNSNENSRERIELYDEENLNEKFPAVDLNVNNKEVMNIMTKESTV